MNTLRRDQKNSRFPGPRAPKIPPRDFFLVDLIHASHAFVLDFHARSIAPTTQPFFLNDSCSQPFILFGTLSLLLVFFWSHTSAFFGPLSNARLLGETLTCMLWHVRLATVLATGPHVTLCARHARAIPDNGCPGISNYFWSRLRLRMRRDSTPRYYCHTTVTPRVTGLSSPTRSVDQQNLNSPQSYSSTHLYLSLSLSLSLSLI